MRSGDGTNQCDTPGLSRQEVSVSRLGATGSAETEMVRLNLLCPADSLRTAGQNEDHIRTLVDLDGQLPPITVHRQSMRVIDGMHRLRAAMLRGQEKINVVFFDGSQFDAFILAVKANIDHGFPLSRGDRIAAVARVIQERPHLSDVAIGEIAGVSGKTVATVRRRSSSEDARLNARTGRDGRVRPIDATSGRLRAAELLGTAPNTPLRQVAKACGISLGTAQDVRQRLNRGEHPVPARAGRNSRSAAWSGTDNRPKSERYRTPESSLASLKADPSVRRTESGRSILELLYANVLPDDDWNRLLEGVPLHQADTVADVAYRCATAWKLFADRLQRRGRHA
jgi:ParB-like chromosome segregation protein Spo0J